MTISRLFPLAIAVVAAAPAHAAQRVDFTRAAFTAAQAQGRPIVVEVKAWWCPTCASQGRTIKAAITAPQYRNLIVFTIDYDKQKAEWQQFGVRKQGTLIAFKGAREIGRIEFMTDKARINALIASTIG